MAIQATRFRQSLDGLTTFPIVQKVITTTQAFSDDPAVGGQIQLPSLPGSGNTQIVRVSAMISGPSGPIPSPAIAINWPHIGWDGTRLFLYNLDDLSGVSPFPGGYSGWVVVDYILANVFSPADLVDNE
jgi:hypothetical protein